MARKQCFNRSEVTTPEITAPGVTTPEITTPNVSSYCLDFM